MDRLIELYRKTEGGHTLLSDDDFIEYAALRKLEYQTRRDELIASSATNIKPQKDEAGDIIGLTWNM